MTIISPTVGKNPLEEMESKMQYLGVISKMTKLFVFISKANHSTSQ